LLRYENQFRGQFDKSLKFLLDFRLRANTDKDRIIRAHAGAYNQFCQELVDMPMPTANPAPPEPQPPVTSAQPAQPAQAAKSNGINSPKEPSTPAQPAAPPAQKPAEPYNGPFFGQYFGNFGR